MRYDRSNASIFALYGYLLAHANGDSANERYMSAWPTVATIAGATGIGHNRVARLADVLEAVGLLRTRYDYRGNKRTKLYYPQYYSTLTDDEIVARLDAIYG